MTNLWEVYSQGKNILKNHSIESHQNDACHIFQKCFGMSRQQLLMNKEKAADSKKSQEFFDMIEKRSKNTPLQYILGAWEFMGLDFEVGEGVLIPREDTEVLVRESAEILSQFSEPHIVDLCTGTGCIAISLEKILTNNPKITAVELSKDSFKYLEKNVKKHDSKVTAVHDDILTCHKNFEDSSLDGIVSNPPYIATGDINSLQAEVKNEPKIALDGGIDGLDFYRKICVHWAPKLKPGGALGFEIGLNQAEKVKNLMIHHGMSFVKTKKDFNSIERVVLGIKSI